MTDGKENEMDEESIVEKAAKSLYARWQVTDAELRTPWEDAGTRLQGVFLRQAGAILPILADVLNEVVSGLDAHEAVLRTEGEGLSCWYWLETELSRRGLL